MVDLDAERVHLRPQRLKQSQRRKQVSMIRSCFPFYPARMNHPSMDTNADSAKGR